MHLPPQDSVPVASLADGSATFFDGGPLGEVDVLLGGAPGFRDGGAVYAKFRGALYLASDYRDQDSVYVSDANNSCIRRVRFRRRQDCGRGPSHAAAPWPELRGRRRYYTVEYADAETLAGRCGPAADAPPAPAGSARRLGVPAGLVVHDGALYVADAGDHVIRRVALPPPPLLLRARRRAGRPAVPVVAPDPQRDLLGAAPKHHRNAEIFRLSPRKISGFPAKIISTMPSNRSGRVSWQLLRRQSVPLERAGPRHQLAGRARLRTAPRRAAMKLRAPLVPETVATGTVVAGKRLL